ncbi:MAG: hypothetical protein AAGI88_24140 [Pseudomonadota bacterium]
MTSRGEGRSQRQASDMLADYLNEHLDDADREFVELSLARDSALREQLQFERNLGVALRAEAELSDTRDEHRSAGFSAISDRLETRAGFIETGFNSLINGWFVDNWRWLAAGVPVAGLLLMLASVDLFRPGMEDGVQEFRTAFDPEKEYAAPTLVVLFHEPLNKDALGQFLTVHDLDLVDGSSVGALLELRPTSSDVDVETIAGRVGRDARVHVVRLVGIEP